MQLLSIIILPLKNNTTVSKLFTILSLFFFVNLHAQIGYNTISSNGMEVGMHADGTLFMDESKSNGGFIVDKDENLVTIFSSSIWASALAPEGFIKSSSFIYGGQGNLPAFSPGSYDITGFDFNQVWKVTGNAIIALINDIEDGTLDNPIDESILNWPGKGNPTLANLPDQDLAPFYDQNGDGIYNPFQGDYPIIGNDLNNVIPVEMMYAVYRDDQAASLQPMGLEYHSLIYSVACDNTVVLDQSIFARHRIVKRLNDVTEFKIGIWTDYDLGCISDDAIGSIPDLNAVISYNIDAFDGTANGDCQFGLSSFGDNPGIQSAVILNQEVISTTGYVGIQTSVPPGMYEPELPLETNNVLSGLWRDGTGMTYGGNGYNLGSTDFAFHIFDGNINNSDEWSVVSENLPFFEFFPLMNMSKSTFNDGEEMIIDMAYILSQDQELNNLETYNQAILDIESVQDLYDQEFPGSCSNITSNSEYSFKELTIIPNPANDFLNIESDYERYKIYDSLGRLVQADSSEAMISILNLTPGMYTIHIIDEDIISVGKFIKQ